MVSDDIEGLPVGAVKLQHRSRQGYRRPSTHLKGRRVDRQAPAHPPARHRVHRGTRNRCQPFPPLRTSLEGKRLAAMGWRDAGELREARAAASAR
ncbi:hypothetical protein ACFPRL_10510 [Pseudoclavibacter helvolus]